MRNLFLSLLLPLAVFTQAATLTSNGLQFTTSGSECTVVRPAEDAYSGTVVIPDEVVDGVGRYTVTAVGDSAFYGSGVEELTLPPTLRRIGAAAFAGCSHLNRLHIADVDSWCAIEFADASSSPFAAQFYGSQKLWVGETETDSIAVGVDVPDFAFCGWECIKKLHLSDDVASIGQSAFSGCAYLNTIYFGNGIRRIGANAFSVCEWLRRVETPSLATWCAIDFATASSCPLSNSRVERFIVAGKEIADLVIGDDCPAVGQYAFYNAPMISSVTIGDGVRTIGRQAFFGCSALRSVSIGNSLTALPLGVFMQCKSLESVSFGESIAEIGQSAFSNCESLASLDLPQSLRSIGQTSFAFLESLVALEVPSGVESLGQGCFSWCRSLEEVKLPSTLRKVGFASFAFCDKLRKVDTGSIDAPEAPSTNPPFSSTAYAEATLTVPQGSADSYRAAPGWKNFTNITENGTTGIDVAVREKIHVGAVDGTLVITAPDGSRWSVFDLSGRLIMSGTGSASTTLPTNLVIVSAEGESYKIILR